MPVVIAPINKPASAAASPAHFSQPSTVVTSSAPGALPSAGGFGTGAANALGAWARTPAAITVAVSALHLRVLLRFGSWDVDIGVSLQRPDREAHRRTGSETPIRGSRTKRGPSNDVVASRTEE